MEIEKYYESSGREHTVKSEWSFGLYRIYVDGEFYANADDRLDKRETICGRKRNRAKEILRPCLQAVKRSNKKGLGQALNCPNCIANARTKSSSRSNPTPQIFNKEKQS